MEQTISFRAKDSDAYLIRMLMSKLGISATSVIKLALRRLAELEKINLKKDNER